MVGAQTSQTFLKIYYKSSIVYLGTKGVVARTTIMRRLAFTGPASSSNNLSSDSRVGEESRRATKERFLRKRPKPWTEIILK